VSSLERRYRRLLAWYPGEFREVYQEEMLGVLLDAAGPERTRPTVRETADLLTGVLRYRLRRAGSRGYQWRRAGSVLAAAAPAMMLVVAVYRFVGAAGLPSGYYGDRPANGPSVWAPPVAWAVVTLAALAGPRLLAAGLGWLALLFEVAVQVVVYERQGLGARPALWTLTLSLVAVAALSLGGGARDGLRLLGWRRLTVLTAIGLFVGAGQIGYYWSAQRLPLWIGMLVWGPGPRALAVLAGVVALARLDPPVRRRLLTVLTSLAALAILEGVSDNWYFADGGRYYLVPLQAFGLLVVTATGFVLACVGIRRRERRPAAVG
jgi:hypothetical protein